MGLNFLDAVIEMNEGRCEYITHPTLGGTLKFDCDFKHSRQLVWSDSEKVHSLFVNSMLRQDWQLVNPIKQYEEVEIVKWYSPMINGYFDDRSDCAIPADSIKLTGTIKKEIKPKVKHREEVEELWNGFQFAEPYKTPFSFKGRKVRLFAEWDE